MFDGTNNTAASLGLFCGSETPTPIVSSGSDIYVEFDSDGNNGRTGFLGTYQATDMCKYLSTWHKVLSGSTSGGIECKRHITADRSHTH